MYSFVSVKKDEEKWVIAAIKWGSNMEMYIEFTDYMFNFDMKGNDVKTELIRNWKGRIGHKSIVEFDNREDSDNAINYIEGLHTAGIITQKVKDKKRGY